MRYFFRKFIFMIAALSVFTLPFTFSTPALAANVPLINAPATNSPSGSGTSFNWSGYEAMGGAFTGVGATWVIPSVAASSSLTADATWVGIGGVTSHDLIQVGTQAVTGNGADQVQYQAWFETLPQTTQQIPLTVNAGDSVTASVTQTSSGEWQISFHDNTTGGQYSTQIAYASSLSSAEWIEETPTDQDGIMPLDQFGSTSFTGAYAIENGNQVTVAGSNAIPLTMTNDANQVLAAPSSLNADGASFTVSRTSAAATVINAPGAGYAWGRGHRIGVGVQGFSPWRGGGNGNSNSNSENGSSSSVPSAPSTTPPFGRMGYSGRGQFRTRIVFGRFGQGQLLQFFREQFDRAF